MARFSDVFEDVTKEGRKIPKENYLASGIYPIVDQGQEYIAGYSNDADGLYRNVPVIIFGDHTRIIKYVDMPFFLGADGVKLLRAKNPNANYKYLYYALSNANIPNTGYNRHFKWLKELDIPIPSEHQQARIVNVLDKVSYLIALRQQQLAKLDALVKARFVEMFGDPVAKSTKWMTEKLSNLGELNRGVSKCRPRNAPELLNGPYPLIQTGDVSNATLYITSYDSTYSEAGLAQSRLWKSGTLCITIAANIAKTAILKFDACFPDSVVGFIPDAKIYPIFVHYWFTFLQKVLEKQAPQVAQKNINLKILGDLDVIVPPIDLQSQFVSFVESVEKCKLTVRQGLDKLEIVKKALIQKYF